MPHYAPHEFCLCADALDPVELAKLESSMRVIGFDSAYPIRLFESKILDGWHRYQAARTVGVEPVFVEFAGTREQALETAYYSLFARRHVQQGRKAAIALRFNQARVANGQPELSHNQLAQVANVSTPYISQASSVQNRDPAVLDRVIGGEMSLAKAYKELARSVPERSDRTDPLFDVWITRDKWKLVIARLQEIADRDIDPLNARRGSEAIRETYNSHVRVDGEISLGRTFLTSLIGRIKANMPAVPCEECLGEGCNVCSQRGWWTSAESRSRTRRVVT